MQLILLHYKKDLGMRLRAGAGAPWWSEKGAIWS